MRRGAWVPGTSRPSGLYKRCDTGTRGCRRRRGCDRVAAAHAPGRIPHARGRTRSNRDTVSIAANWTRRALTALDMETALLLPRGSSVSEEASAALAADEPRRRRAATA